MSARGGKTRADDERDLLMMHLMDNEGLSASVVRTRFGVTRNAVLGVRHRIRTDYARSCEGDPDPDRHDATMPPLWWRGAYAEAGRQ